MNVFYTRKRPTQCGSTRATGPARVFRPDWLIDCVGSLSNFAWKYFRHDPRIVRTIFDDRSKDSRERATRWLPRQDVPRFSDVSLDTGVIEWILWNIFTRCRKSFSLSRYPTRIRTQISESTFSDRCFPFDNSAFAEQLVGECFYCPVSKSAVIEE